MDFPPPLDMAQGPDTGTPADEAVHNVAHEVSVEPHASFEPQEPFLPSTSSDPQPQEGFLVDLAAIHSLPAAVVKKKRSAPVDDWEIEKPLQGECRRRIKQPQRRCPFCARAVTLHADTAAVATDSLLGIVFHRPVARTPPPPNPPHFFLCFKMGLDTLPEALFKINERVLATSAVLGEVGCLRRS